MKLRGAGAGPVAFFFRAVDVSAGCLDLAVAKAVGKVEFQQTAFGVACAVEVLPGVGTGYGPMHGIKDVADGGLYRCPAVEQRLLQSAVEAPHGMAPERTLQNTRRSVVLGDICRPTLAQLEIVLRKNGRVEDVQVDHLSDAEIGFV